MSNPNLRERRVYKHNNIRIAIWDRESALHYSSHIYSYSRHSDNHSECFRSGTITDYGSPKWLFFFFSGHYRSISLTLLIISTPSSRLHLPRYVPQLTLALVQSCNRRGTPATFATGRPTLIVRQQVY